MKLKFDFRQDKPATAAGFELGNEAVKETGLELGSETGPVDLGSETGAEAGGCGGFVLAVGGVQEGTATLNLNSLAFGFILDSKINQIMTQTR